jgi:hypothetical protein
MKLVDHHLPPEIWTDKDTNDELSDLRIKTFKYPPFVGRVITAL